MWCLRINYLPFDMREYSVLCLLQAEVEFPIDEDVGGCIIRKKTFVFALSSWCLEYKEHRRLLCLHWNARYPVRSSGQ